LINSPPQIEAIAIDRLADYASVPMICHVKSVLEVSELNNGTGQPNFRERPTLAPYVKNYDAHGSPLRWPQVFDISNWRIWIATDAGAIVGGAAIARKTPSLDILEGRDDIAALWDIRVREANKRQGIGASLFRTAAIWAKSRDCRQLKIETQNVNVPACRFYHKMGASLARIDPHAYRGHPGLEGEVQLIWNLAI
jgi:GNAT superfamily N-acetyltransferase